MPRYRRPTEALAERFARLMRELEDDSGDRPAMVDERDYFRLVDMAAEDPETDPAVLEDAGKRFARHFVTPYLHADDPAVLVAEIGALLAIHHRANINVEAVEATPNGLEVVIAFQRLQSDGPKRMTPFDMAIVRHALAERDPKTQLEPLGSEDDTTSRFRIHLRRD